MSTSSTPRSASPWPRRASRERYADWLVAVQNDLFDVGADLAVPPGGERERLRVVEEQVAWLERACDEVNDTLEPLKSFILPGGSPAAAQLHVCRTVCRRAERRAVALAAEDGQEVGEEVIRYLNRLSDLSVHPRPWRKRRGRAALGAGAHTPLSVGRSTCGDSLRADRPSRGWSERSAAQGEGHRRGERAGEPGDRHRAGDERQMRGAVGREDVSPHRDEPDRRAGAEGEDRRGSEQVTGAGGDPSDGPAPGPLRPA